MIDLIKQGDLNYTLEKLGEKDECLITKSKRGLTVFPVDNDINNMLPTNIACLSRDKLETIDLMVYGYITRPRENIAVYFETFRALEDHNTEIISLYSTTMSEPAPGSEIEYIKSMFNDLAIRHAKGVFKIEIGNYSLNCMQYQHWLFNQLTVNNKNKSTIIQ